MAKVFLGVGHGGSDPGAVANGFNEKDLNLSIALACNAELIRHGVTVQMSRTKDENDTLNDEIRECNAFNPDYAVDIHNNAGGGDGVEAFYHHGGGKGKVLADNVLAEIVKIGQNSRGAKTKKNSAGKDYFGFIRETKAPAIIVECAFVDNAADMQIIDTEAERKTMGIAIAKGILSTLGIAYVEEKKPEAPIAKEYVLDVEKLKAEGYSKIVFSI
jgi:N-acetylmuramoyl-L-alanine amidase